MKKRSYYQVERLLSACLMALCLAGSTKADFIFGKAQSLGISGGVPWVTADDLELYFVSDRAGVDEAIEALLSRPLRAED